MQSVITKLVRIVHLRSPMPKTDHTENSICEANETELAHRNERARELRKENEDQFEMHCRRNRFY